MTSSKNATNVAPGITTRSKKSLVARCMATSSKNATKSASEVIDA